MTVPLAAGATPRVIRLLRAGFDEARVELTPQVLAAGRVRVPLQQSEPARVRVSLSGSYPFSVEDGGRTISPASEDHALSLTEGRQLRLRAPAVYLDQRVTVRGSGGGMRVEVPPLGSVSVRSVVENCAMRIDGVPTDAPPVYQKPVAGGEHTIDLLCDGDAPRRQRVLVRPGENSTVLFRQ
jgi:hypothetical protein